VKIFEVHLNRYRPGKVKDFQIPLLGQVSKEFSGAEIEQVVIDAMRIGFNENREFTNEDILISVQNVVPLARTRSKEIDLLIEWAESGNVISASKYR
jgi:SpoVK/Ycf46/Vps4 family AAA+-type ATPase